MILHVSHDDKFLDIFINRQRKYFPESRNIYLVYTDSGNPKLVKSDGIYVTKLYSRKFWEIVKNPGITKVFIHYFSLKLSDFVLNIPGHIPVYWLFYGSDGFYLPSIAGNFLDNYSLSFIKKKYPHLLLNYLNYKFPITIRWQFRVKKHIKAMRRIDYFCHYILDDYKIIKEATGFKAEFLEFNYGSIDDLADVKDKQKLINNEAKSSIFVGNSACENNNHIGAFHFIKEKIDTGVFDRIYCPLSYSGHKGYVIYVIKEGRKMFKDKFKPLISFMTREEYNNILGECFLFINNHKRSQAFGNIAWQLYAGGNVAMNPMSTLFKYLSSQGIMIPTLDSNFNLLEVDARIKNSELITDLLSERNVVKRYGRLFLNR